MVSREQLITACCEKFDDVNHELSIFMGSVRTWFEMHPKLIRGARPVIHSVKSRIKDREHLAEKINRKLELIEGEIEADDLFNRLTDLSGVRILLLHQQQYRDVHAEFLKKISNDWYLVEPPKAYTWDPESADFFRSLGIDTQVKDSQYTSLHYVVRPRAGADVVCEIQVRTLFEEIWGEVDHALNYPAPTDNVACSEQLRVLAKLVGAGSRLVDSIYRSSQPMEVVGTETIVERAEASVEHLAQTAPSAPTPPAEPPQVRPDEEGAPTNPEIF
ncbi:MAG: RelA/SpoT domain-containing protein [Pseudomonas qingdaonensis]|uniref:RelA/SpoT domain-containing protein n=1 Tax=Pseudomonas qingdaonensis TaxID=2056231 RepID=UPI0033150AEA